VLFLEVFVLFNLVIDDIVHHCIEGLIAAVTFDLLYGRVEDGIFELFGEPVPEGIISCRYVVDRGDVSDVSG
jgi:hypothetical protein